MDIPAIPRSKKMEKFQLQAQFFSNTVETYHLALRIAIWNAHFIIDKRIRIHRY